MRITILHNRDHHLLDEDPGREAREDVVRVAAALEKALEDEGERPRSSDRAEPGREGAASPTRRPGRRKVSLIGVDRDIWAIGKALEAQRPDVVINLCESLAADARGEMVVPALLEMTGLPYTGNSAMSLGLSLHKDKAKELLLARGVPTPQFAVVRTVAELISVTLPFPLIVKPAREDASVGIDFDAVVNDRAALGKAVSRVLRTFRQPALVERYVDGREIYVPLLGNNPRRALPLTEIHYGKAFEGRAKVLTYKAKWDETSAECLDSAAKPASLTPALERRCIETAMAAWAALDCRDYGRVDLRVDRDGQPFVIDINPNCDLHPHSGFAKAAAAAGIGYPDLAWHLIELAQERSHGNSATESTRSPAARRAVGAYRDVHSRRGGMRARAHRPGRHRYD